MKIVFISLFIIGSLTGCTTNQHSTCDEFTRNTPMLSANEVAQLQEIELNNEFISGCVTEEIADMSELFCLTSNDLSQQLSFSQWSKIYKSCMVNK